MVDNLEVTGQKVHLPVIENTEFQILEGVGFAKADVTDADP